MEIYSDAGNRQPSQALAELVRTAEGAEDERDVEEGGGGSQPGAGPRVQLGKRRIRGLMRLRSDLETIESPT